MQRQKFARKWQVLTQMDSDVPSSSAWTTSIKHGTHDFNQIWQFCLVGVTPRPYYAAVECRKLSCERAERAGQGLRTISCTTELTSALLVRPEKAWAQQRFSLNLPRPKRFGAACRAFICSVGFNHRRTQIQVGVI